jgi:protein SCO1
MRPFWRQPARLIVLLGVSLGILVACDHTARRSASDLAGVPVDPPRPKPELTLTATDGQSFDLRRDTEGHLTFLFFGFTHCPDICPVHLSNLAAALSRLSYEDRQRTRVVFVSVDPERDSLPRLREWLDGFDRSFIGLRGPMTDINRAEDALGFPTSTKLHSEHGESYNVGHSTQIIVFHPATDSAYVTYPFGTRQSDWSRDLPRLLRDGGR